MDCKWIILAPVDSIIELNWSAFEIEDSSRCQFDYVSIYDNGTAGGGEVAKYCGANKPPTMITSNNMITIEFVTDSSRNSGGFSVIYRFLNASSRKLI